MIEVTVPKPNKIERDLTLFPEKATKIYAVAVQRAGIAYRDFVKQMRAVSAPRDGYSAKGIPVDSGNLRRAIRSRRIGLLAAGVGIGKPAEAYGAAVHDGTPRTDRVKPRPFFEWALEDGAQREIDDIMNQAMLLLP
jgi:hypothetical protein